LSQALGRSIGDVRLRWSHAKRGRGALGRAAPVGQRVGLGCELIDPRFGVGVAEKTVGRGLAV
jgi:hypothetical protein